MRALQRRQLEASIEASKQFARQPALKAFRPSLLSPSPQMTAADQAAAERQKKTESAGQRNYDWTLRPGGLLGGGGGL